MVVKRRGREACDGEGKRVRRKRHVVVKARGRGERETVVVKGKEIYQRDK